MTKDEFLDPVGGEVKKPPARLKLLQEAVEFFWDQEWEDAHPPREVKMVPYEGGDDLLT
jgi:hypothetical protein